MVIGDSTEPMDVREDERSNCYVFVGRGLVLRWNFAVEQRCMVTSVVCKNSWNAGVMLRFVGLPVVSEKVHWTNVKSATVKRITSVNGTAFFNAFCILLFYVYTLLAKIASEPNEYFSSANYWVVYS